ncbi:lipid kinase [Hansschlegelia sp.]|uniref:lipid kinase n=1 Tax=Hansschlegelia sp. TaxID=2041892 RepID=UPI002CAD6C37|nr:lipid kinase [Hansschlegelia sp.]HVI28004.1 lipid kinase [Hansschlegelia sp.]
MRRALLVVNAKSRSGEVSAKEIREELEGRGFAVTPLDCDSPDKTSALIAQEGPAYEVIVVGGGDGSMNAAARGVMEAGRPLGIVPTGTANDLARTLDIPADIPEACRIIAEGEVRRIDLGEVNDRLFFNVASIGLSAELAQELTSEIKQRFGKLGYVITALKVLARAKPFRVSIRSGDRSCRALTLQVAVGNGRYYGGGNVIEQNAEIDDGRLDLYSLEFSRAWRLALMLRSFRAGEHGAWSEVRSMSGDEFEIRTHRPRSVNADGEIVTKTPAVFRLRPKAIEVIAPPKQRLPERD